MAAPSVHSLGYRLVFGQPRQDEQRHAARALLRHHGPLGWHVYRAHDVVQVGIRRGSIARKPIMVTTTELRVCPVQLGAHVMFSPT